MSSTNWPWLLAHIRTNYWIIHANAIVCKVFSDCTFCRKKFKQSESQKNGQFTRIEVNLAPFLNVGLDCFGPFLTRNGRGFTKRYGLIFTCLSLRAVHIEAAYSLNTSSLIQALRRFIVRRGQVLRIWTDNGTHFVGGEHELRDALKLWNQEQIHVFLLQKGIDWKFNPFGASHFGGIWERQIRSIRKILAGLCDEQ